MSASASTPRTVIAACVRDGEVDNDLTLELLAKTAISHAAAGADAVAPSDMMDGRIGAIRGSSTPRASETADHRLLGEVRLRLLRPLPRRRRLDAREFGDRRGYQMDPANADEAIREVAARPRRGRRRA